MTDSDNTRTEQGVDGYSDTRGEQTNESPDQPDYGQEGRVKPLSEEERMEAEREIQEQGDRNRLTEHKHEDK